MMDPKSLELRKFVAPELVFGEGALDLVSRYALNLGAGKVLIVTDPGVRAAGWTGRVKEELRQAGISYALFDRLTPNPKDYEVMEGADFYQCEQCDLIIAVGGGSSMDCAKGIGIVSTNGKHILKFEGVDEVAIPGPPLICIPTTAGSSADVSQFAIITDSTRRVKIGIISKTTVPDVALIDPQTTTTMPSELTAATGVDALVHACEAYVSNASSPLTDLCALEAIRLVAGHLYAAIQHPQDPFHRSQMMLGSLMAGLAFSNASLGLVHSMAHSLGGRLDLAHGECNAILLEPVVAFNFQAARQRYIRIGEAMGLTMQGLDVAEQKNELLHALSDFCRKVGIRKTLSDLGVTQSDLAPLAQLALQDPCLATNPITPTVQEIEQIYERVL